MFGPIQHPCVLHTTGPGRERVFVAINSCEANLSGVTTLLVLSARLEPAREIIMGFGSINFSDHAIALSAVGSCLLAGDTSTSCRGDKQNSLKKDTPPPVLLGERQRHRWVLSVPTPPQDDELPRVTGGSHYAPRHNPLARTLDVCPSDLVFQKHGTSNRESTGDTCEL